MACPGTPRAGCASPAPRSSGSERRADAEGGRGAPPCELLFIALVKEAIRRRIIGAPGAPWAQRSSIERFFGRVFLFFHLQRPPLTGWSAVAACVALTYAGVGIVALAAADAGRPDLLRSSKRVLAHSWEGRA